VINGSERIIHLPHLQWLRLDTNLATTYQLLQELAFVPPSARVWICEPPDLSELMEYLPFGICHLSPLQITPTTHLRFRSKEGLSLHSAGAEPWSDDGIRLRVVRNAQLANDDYLNQWLPTIPTHFDVSLLTTLELEVNSTFNLTVLENFLFSMPLLHTLRVDGRSSALAVAALSTIRADSMPPSPCPLLGRIEIREGNKLLPHTLAMQPIVEGLRARFVSLGHPLQTLVFDGFFSEGTVTSHFGLYVAEIVFAIK